MNEYIVEYTIRGKIKLESETTNSEEIESEAIDKINSGELGDVDEVSIDNLEDIEETLNRNA